MIWRPTRLKFLAAIPIRNGLGEAGAYDNQAWPRYIRTTDIAGPRQLRNDVFVSLPPDVAKAALLQPGDIVMTAAGATIGKSLLYDDDRQACYAGYLVRFRAGVDVDPRFVAYWMESQPYWDQIAIGKVVSTIDNFSASKYQNLRLDVPEFEVQHAIADYLDGETARIDALMAVKRRMLALIREREQVTMSRWLIPASCQFASLRRFAKIQGGLTIHAGRDVNGAAVTRPYLRVANVQAGRLDLTDISEVTVPRILADRATLRLGDVLMTEGGDIDKLGRGTMWAGDIPGCLHQNHIFAVRTRSDCLDPDYLALLTGSHHARAYFERVGVQSTNLASISASNILGLPVPVIPIVNQREIVSRWNEHSAHTRRLWYALDSQIALLREHRQALITAAVTGELDISQPEAAAA
jgi:type I restriction enzyme S subunit